ncbi:MAG: hypothetical protein HY821_15230 [Acidobacteria bacterium]|nr:hypothetical protein [Acidobacteriota bacterium]
MKAIILSMLAVGALCAQGPAKSYTGVITDTMCGANHKHMGVSPDSKCVVECVKNGGGKWKYALLVGKDMYVLSDQQAPERFAAQKVTVTGVLYEKTGVLKVEKLAPAR